MNTAASISRREQYSEIAVIDCAFFGGHSKMLMIFTNQNLVFRCIFTAATRRGQAKPALRASLAKKKGTIDVRHSPRTELRQLRNQLWDQKTAKGRPEKPADKRAAPPENLSAISVI
jgi:hypothetical protein